MPDRSTHSDALVFFGATGDLAYKKVFPALQVLIQHDHLDVPMVGVAKSGWNLEQFRARARDSLEKHGGIDEAAFAKLLRLIRYVDGDYNDPSTFVQLRDALARPGGRCITWRFLPAFSASLRNIWPTPDVPMTPAS